MSKPAPLVISDHALVRYLERVEGFDIEQLRRAIADRLQDAHVLGASAVTIERHTYRIANGVLTTVVPRHMRFPRPSKSEQEFGQ